MIQTLRKRFITISILAVACVMVLLFAAVNTVNFISVNGKLNNTLNMISDNGGEMPHFKPENAPTLSAEDETDEDEAQRLQKPDDDFNEETPFSTRYFVLYYDENGEKTDENLSQIAAVTEEETESYVKLAYAHGEGYGFTENYKYKVTKTDDDNYMAVFVNDNREMNSTLTLFFISLGATVFCIALISLMIVLFSKKAMQPVAESYAKQKQFITDASHELKTPITVIGTGLSVLEMEVGENKWIDKAKAQCAKLKELVNSLVTLSKMDEEKTSLQFLEFDISFAVSETALSFADYAAARGHTLQTDITPDLRYKGDEYAVRQLCSILIDNAIKYAAADAPIYFSMHKNKKGVLIFCENAAENIDTKELDKLFERFYRSDKSRNSQTGGFGIGLSIARSICEAHGGSIHADSPDGKNIVFTAKLK